MIFHQRFNSQSNFNYNRFTYTDWEYAPHFHKNQELILVLKGTISVTVNGRQQQASEGEMVLILSNQIHAFSVPKEAKIWVAVFSKEYVPLFAAAIKGQQGVSSVFQPGNALRSMVQEHLIQSDGSRMMKKACFYGICDTYLQSVALEPRPDKTSFLVGNLLDWIAENYTKDISLKMAAEVFGYEYHYLSRLLNKSYGIRFVNLLNGYRVEHAAQLLRSTQLPISEIALQSGFQSLRSFNQVFMEQTGVTPNTLRVGND